MSSIRRTPRRIVRVLIVCVWSAAAVWIAASAAVRAASFPDWPPPALVCGQATPAAQGAAAPCEPAGKGDVSFVLTWTWQGDTTPLGPDIDIFVVDPKGVRLNTSRTGAGMGPTAEGGQVDRDDQAGYGGTNPTGKGPERVFWPSGAAPAGKYKYGCYFFEGQGTAQCTLSVYLKGAKVASVTEEISMASKRSSREYEFDSGGALVSQPANVNEMTLQAAARQVQPGTVVSIPVWLIKAANIASMDYDLRYDPSVVRLEDKAAPGQLLKNSLLASNPGTSGVVKIGFAGTASLSGTDTVSVLTFRAVGAPKTRTPLTLTITGSNAPGGEAVRVAKIDGLIEILGPGDTASTDCLPDNTKVKGDCDGDRRLTAGDALCALRMGVNLMSPDLNLDLTNDQKVNANDARAILRSVVTSR